MKFPKSMHAEGWADHIDTNAAPKRSNPLGPAGTRRGAGAKISASAPLNPAMEPVSNVRMDALHVNPSVTAAPPMVAAPAPRVNPAPAAPRTHAAVLPPEDRRNQLSWMVPAAAGAVVIAGVAVWAMNRPHVEPTTPPAIVTGSAEAPTQVAAVTEPPPAADRDDSTAAQTPTPAAAPAATPEPAEPARLGPPVTTVKPAVEPRAVTVAQAPVPAPRPDLVVRANPRDTAPAPTPYLQPLPPTTVAAAPAATPSTEAPTPVTPGNAPINLPPTAAGPAATPQAVQPAVTPQPATPPVATAPAADSTAPVATSPGTPPLAQATQPVAEDSGITLKVRSALLADATLAAVPISVSTDHGVVKLEGQAPDAPTRERATVVASSALGVKAVDNRLTLPPAPMVSQAPSGL